MFKKILDKVWAFDAEWAPDPAAGRLLHGLPESMSDADVMKEMWAKGGATEEDPTPFLKTILCRVLTIAAVTRSRSRDGQVTLHMTSLPKDLSSEEDLKESHLIDAFLSAVGKHKPQLVGYNSVGADIRILVQRAIVNGLTQPAFSRRPDKPWEGPDYFNKMSDWNVDLQDAVTPGWGRGNPSLNELASLSGIPGKMDVAGDQVPQMWLDGRLPEILAYNEYDALTTYLVWLRLAHFGGFFNDELYAVEQARLKDLILAEMPTRPHFEAYLTEWNRLRRATGQAELS
ncbi:MAG: 3'-5' exonuclease [Magnetococcales bacterium]|nr:3'-5' exonuclease [Magnetococcales bacterium]